MTVIAVLALIALLLVIASFFRSEYPFLAVAVLLVVICLLIPSFVK